MKKTISYALSAAALLAGSAFAQSTYPDTTSDTNRDTTRDTVRDSARDTARDAAREGAREGAREARRDPTRPNLATKIGMEVQVGGGVEGFIDKDASNVAKPGGDWTGRLILGTRSHIAAEAAYMGSAQNLDTLGVSNKATLMSNGLEALARLNILTGPVQPYAVAGYAWRHYRVAGTNVNTSSVAQSDNVNAIPVGVGVAFRASRLVADLRVTLQGAFGRELIPNANLSTYAANAKVGFEF